MRRRSIVLHPRSAAIAFACAAALAGIPASAAEPADLADMSIEELMDLNIKSVFGASRYEQRVTQAPSSISIVTAADIRRFGYTNFEDVLRGLRGVYVTDDRNYTYLGVRGFLRPGDYNTRVLLLIDGHRVNDNVYDSGATGREAMVDVSVIERVEFIRGPSSSVYGSSAFFGVINVITKRGSDIDGVEVGQELGSLDTRRTHANYGTKFSNGTEWIASASHYSSGGMERIYYPEFDQRISDDPRARNDGLALGLDDETATKFFTSVRSGNWSATAYYSERDKQIPTASYETIFADPENRTIDLRGYADVAVNGDFNSQLHYQGRAFYDFFKYTGIGPYDDASPGDPAARYLYRDRSSGEWVGTEVQLTATLSSIYTLAMGVEYRANLAEQQTAYDDVDPRIYYIDSKSSSSVLGAFSQVEARLRDDFSLTAGLRYDRYSELDTVNPRIAAIYNPTTSSALKLLYGEAFRAPNPYEKFYYYEEQQFHPALEPETIRTYEFVYEQYFGKRYRLNVSTYYYEIDGLISQRASETGLQYFANTDAVNARGAELEFEANYDSGVTARMSYTLQRSKDLSTQQELTSSPRQLAKLAVSVPVVDSGVFGNVEVQYHGESLTLSGERSPSFVLTHVSVTTQKLWSDVELSLAVKNVFDAHEVYPAAEEHLQDTLSLPGRTYVGELVVRF